LKEIKEKRWMGSLGCSSISEAYDLTFAPALLKKNIRKEVKKMRKSNIMWRRKRVIISDTSSLRMIYTGYESEICVRSPYLENDTLKHYTKMIKQSEENGANIVSAISHKDTSILLLEAGFEPEWMKFNKVDFEAQEGDLVLCFCPNFTPEESRMLTLEEKLKRGFTIYEIDFFLHRRLDE